MSATTATFTFNTGSAGAYDWSAVSNWTTGAVPINGEAVFVAGGPSGAVSVDDVSGLSLSALTVQNTTSGRTIIPGVVEIAPGNTLSVTGQIAGNGTIDLLGANTTLVAGVSDLGGPAVAFDLNATSVPEEIVLTGALSPGQTVTDLGRLANFYFGDSIDFTMFTNIGTVNAVAGGSMQVVGTLAGGGTATYDFNNYQSNITVFNVVSQGANGTVLEATCFAAGSRVLTPAGERAVETLAEGDLLTVLNDGVTAVEPICWVGRLSIDLRRHARPEMVAPVRIRRGAFADGVPHRDLLLSPEHCVFTDGHLVSAKCLVNGMTIVQDYDQPAIEYYHIETRDHAIAVAEGLPVETYLDTGNRAIFENAGTALILHPEFHINAGLRQWASDACAPLADDAMTIEPIWRRLVARARMQGYVPPARAVTAETDLRLRVGGRSFAPVVLAPDRAVFALPGGLGRDMVLTSRYGSPADHAAWRNDHRRLGVAVRQIVIRSGLQEQVLTMDHPALAGGWHPVEGAGAEAWRWTDGEGRIRLQDSPAAAVVEVHLCGSMTYLVQSEPARDSRAA